MDYSDSFRQKTPSRRYSQRANDYSEIVPSHRYPAAHDSHDSSSRPGPSLVPPIREDSRPGRIDEEEIVIEYAGPSAHRASAPRARVSGEPEVIRVDSGASRPEPVDRRARVDDEPEPSYDDPGPSSRPSRLERRYEIEVEPGLSVYGRERGRRRYEAEDEYKTYRRPSGRDDVPMTYYVDGHRRSSGVPPPPPGPGYAPPPIPPGFGSPPLAYAHDRRRTHSGYPGPPPPPPYVLPVVDEERRESRRHSARQSLPLGRPPPPRPVPFGVVTPSPYLVSSYQQPPNSGSGEGYADGGDSGGEGGGGGGKGRHDLATLAEHPYPKDREKVRNSVVLCVYRHSKKAFDFRFVELRRSSGRRLDREEKPAVTDLHLFRMMRRTYEKDLRGWIRRLFSFKHLSTVRLLQYGDGLFFRPDQEDDIFSSKFMRIWRNPREELDGAMDLYEWNKWLLQQKNLEYEFDMAIELIEDYVPERIVFFVGILLIGIVGLTAAWLIAGGEPGNVSTVMSFVLTFIAAVIALTGIWDWFDSDRSKEIQQRAVMVLPERYVNHDPLSIFDGPGQKAGGKH